MIIDQKDSNQKVFQVTDDLNQITASDFRAGYVPPELAVSDHPAVSAVATHISRPKFIMEGLKRYERDQRDFDLGTEDTKRHRLRTVANAHCAPVLHEMKEALKVAQSKFDQLEAKRKQAYEAPRVEVAQRLNQIRNELQSMDSESRIHHIARALRENDNDTIAAIAAYPQNENVCPKAYYWQASHAHEANHMGPDSLVHQDLVAAINGLERSIESFEVEAAFFGAGENDAGEAIYNAAINADFEGGN